MLDFLRTLASAKTAFCEKLDAYVLITDFSADNDGLLLVEILEPLSKRKGKCRPEYLTEFA